MKVKLFSGPYMTAKTLGKLYSHIDYSVTSQKSLSGITFKCSFSNTEYCMFHIIISYLSILIRSPEGLLSIRLYF